MITMKKIEGVYIVSYAKAGIRVHCSTLNHALKSIAELRKIFKAK